MWKCPNKCTMAFVLVEELGVVHSTNGECPINETAEDFHVDFETGEIGVLTHSYFCPICGTELLESRDFMGG